MAKIVIDARESGTSSGRYIDKLVEYLYKLKPEHEFIILTKQHRIAYMKVLAPDFKVIECPYKEFTFAEQLGFWWQVRKLKADLVHFPLVQQPILYGGRVVTSMLDLTTVRFRNPAKNWVIFTVKQQVYKVVNIIAAKKSRLLITPTKFVKQDVVNYCHVKPGKITVIYDAADKISDKPVPVDHLIGKQFIMYLGRPLPHKNLQRLVDAFTELQKTHPDLHLVLAGKKDVLYQRIEQSVKDTGIKNVVFTDFVSEGQLRWLYEHTSVYVFPSLSEGFGLPGLEAMLHDAPVASSNATCLPEVYKDGAIYFDPLDVHNMADVISKLLANKKLASDIATKGHKVALGYSWARMAEQTLEVYDKALQNR